MAKQGNNFKNAKRSGLQPRMPKKPVGGFQSWMVVGLVIAVISLFFFSKETTLQPITIKQFESMLIQKEVEKVIIVNDKIVEVSLKSTFIPKYFKKNTTQKLVPAAQVPHFEFEINSKESFERFLEDRQKTFPRNEQIMASPETRTGPLDWLGTWGFFILMGLSFYFLFFRMGGGAGGGGQIFNIGRSRATLIEGESKVKITFNDVAGLDEAKEEIQEIVEFLKFPKKFTDLGVKFRKVLY